MRRNKLLNEFTPMGLAVITTAGLVLIGIIGIVAFIVFRGF